MANKFEAVETKQQVIDEQLRRKAEAIALFMGGDYNMTAGVGPYGSGWHWDFAKNHVNMDAKDLLEEDENVVKGVAAHEGNHRSFSRPEYFMDMWQEPGFSFGFNAVEDPRVNEGGIKFRPGSKEWIQAYIERDLSPGGGLDYKGVQTDARNTLGYVPKFMQWGGEMIHYWYEREIAGTIRNEDDIENFLEDIPDDTVRETVKKTIPAFEDFYKMLPDRKDELEVKKSARESADNFKNRMWPEYKKLVDQSYQDHSLVKMLEDMLTNDAEQSEGGQAMVIPFSSLPQEVQDEIREKIKDAQKSTQQKGKQSPQQGKQQTDSSDAEQGQDGQAQQNAGQGEQDQSGTGQQQAAGVQSDLETESQKGQTGRGSAQAASTDQPGTKQQAGQPPASAVQSANEQDAQQGEATGKQPTAQTSGQPAEQTASSQGQAGEQGEIGKQSEDKNGATKVPWDELSDEAKQAVAETFDQLPEQKKEAYKDQAKQELENAEDEANEQLRGKMNDPRHTETHKERRGREEQEQERKTQQQQNQKVIYDMQKRQAEILKDLPKNPYHDVLILPEVAELIRTQDYDYRRIFAPDDTPRTRYAYTGLRFPMKKAMPYEADPRDGKIAEVRGRPLKKSHRFLRLVDLSPSMQSIIAEVFKTIVVSTELDNKHNLEDAVLGLADNFPGRVQVYKAFETQRLAQADRDLLGQMIADCFSSSGTPLIEATKKGYAFLKQRMGRVKKNHNYYITLTDGEPTDGSVVQLANQVAKIRKDQTVVTAGFGIGPGTDFVNNVYPQMPDQTKRDIARKLGKTPEQISNSFANAVEFANASVIIMGYMVKHPELFHREV